MCLAAIAIGAHPRFPLIVAANRDEFFGRPAGALAWWTPDRGGVPILSGRDLQGGGTWLGLSPAGRFALLTNVRRPGSKNDAAPSRGSIVPTWLRGDLDADTFWTMLASAGHNPFNVIAGDVANGRWHFGTSGAASMQALDRGLFGLSNAALDTPWPKVTALKARTREALLRSLSVDDLAHRLFAALADDVIALDDALPATGIPLDWERALSPAFIRMSDRGYGTRCSTLVITERSALGTATHVFERSFGADGSSEAVERHARLPGWPSHAAVPSTAPLPAQSERTISTCGMPASSNTGPRSTKPARA
jgi:uncharacterized protein with NRDE domain